MVVDPTLPDGLEQHAWSRVTVRLRDGRTLDVAAARRLRPSRPAADRRAAARQVPGLRGAACSARDEAEARRRPDRAASKSIPDIRALTARLVAGTEE